MREEEQDKLIEAYITGTITTEDKERLETLADQNDEVRQAISELKAIDKDLKIIGKRNFESAVAEWEDELTDPPVKSRNDHYRPYMAIAAAMLILAVAGILLFSPTGTEQLYTSYYETYDDVLSTRGADTDRLLAKGMQAYNSADFPTAATLLEEYTAENENDLAILYLGISYLEINADQQAAQVFMDNIKSPTIGQQAEWYLGLTYLKTDQQDKAAEVFHSIASNTNHYQKEAAVVILDQLE